LLAVDLQVVWRSRWNVVLTKKLKNQNVKIVHFALDFSFCAQPQHYNYIFGNAMKARVLSL